MKIFIRIAIIILLYSNKLVAQQITPSEQELISVVDQFRKSTVSFGIVATKTFRNLDDSIVSRKIYTPIGTGICYYVKFKDIVLPCLITAKHVIFDSLQKWSPDTLNVRFSNSDSLTIDKYFGVPLVLKQDSMRFWLPHPDPTIDLACIFLDPRINWSLSKWPILPYSFFATDEDYFEGKEIYTLGYPSAIGVDLQHHAFLRKGIIAWVDKSARKENKKILIDCNIFPGNSGGPVFSSSKNQGQILMDTVLQMPRFYGIVSQRRFSQNSISSSNGNIRDGLGAEIFSIESIAVGVIITASKVRELLDLAYKYINGLIKENVP